MTKYFEGIVKMYNESSRFGFISYQGGDIFFYSKTTSFKKGDKVVFETKQGKKGLEAVGVEILETSVSYRRLNSRFYQKITSTYKLGNTFETIEKSLVPKDRLKSIEDGRRNDIQGKWDGRRNAIFFICEERESRLDLEFKGDILMFDFRPSSKTWKVKGDQYGYWKCPFHGIEKTLGNKLSGIASDYFDISIELKSDEVKEASYTAKETDSYLDEVYSDRGWSSRTLEKTVTKWAMARVIVETYTITPKAGFEFLGTRVQDFTTTKFL